MVSEKEIMPVRVKFSKLGDLMYISHLDLSRTMQRIIVRSGVDIWYSEGFNPQPRIVFAMPLSVGMESTCELMDFKINAYMPAEEIKERISKNFPEEMKVLDVYTPEVKFKEIAYADYTLKLFVKDINDELCQKINNLVKKECFVTKKTKSGEKEIDISSLINKLEAKPCDGFIEINTVVSAGNENILNPELIVDAIRRETGILNTDSIDEYYTIMRNKMLYSNLEEFK